MRIAAAVLLLLPSVAHAEDRDYCPTRPGLATAACTMEPGRVSVETAIADWERDDQPDSRTDTILIGDTVVRIGVADTTEAVVGWTPYGHVRAHDRRTGVVDRAGRVGDVTLGFKTSLANPDGKGLSVAVMPYATLPVGRMPVGAGDWAAGVLVPVTYDLTDTLNLEFTPEVAAAVDEDGSGRHLAYSAVGGVSIKLGEKVSATIEAQAIRDSDPDGHATQIFAAGSVAWMAADSLQFDAGAVAGLNHDAPDARVYAGVSRRF